MCFFRSGLCKYLYILCFLLFCVSRCFLLTMTPLGSLTRAPATTILKNGDPTVKFCSICIWKHIQITRQDYVWNNVIYAKIVTVKVWHFNWLVEKTDAWNFALTRTICLCGQFFICECFYFCQKVRTTAEWYAWITVYIKIFCHFTINNLIRLIFAKIVFNSPSLWT